MSILEIVLLNLLLWEKEPATVVQIGTSRQPTIERDALFIKVLLNLSLLETLVTERRVIVLERIAQIMLRIL